MLSTEYMIHSKGKFSLQLLIHIHTSALTLNPIIQYYHMKNHAHSLNETSIIIKKVTRVSILSLLLLMDWCFLFTFRCIDCYHDIFHGNGLLTGL